MTIRAILANETGRKIMSQRLINIFRNYYWKFLKFVGVLGLVCGVNLPAPALAVIEIEVTKGGFNAIPIAIAPFAWGGIESPVDVAGVILSLIHI